MSHTAGDEAVAFMLVTPSCIDGLRDRTMVHCHDCHCDHCLVTRMCSTNPADRQQGWEAWYERDAPALRVFLERRCQALHALEHSEDLLQDTFLLGFRNVSSGRYVEQGRSLCAYLYGIAKNLLHEVARLQRKKIVDAVQEETPAHEEVSMEARLCLEEVLTWIKNAHDQQPPLSRQIIDRLYIEEKSSNEVAVELCKTAGNIRAIARQTVIEMGRELACRYNLHISSSTIRASLQLLS